MNSTNSTHGAAGARVADILRQEILDGVFAPGDRIRQEDLAERLGASRAPAREALRLLEAEGLITVVANTGAWVTELSLAECEELYQMRERIEPLLLRYNVALLSDDVLARMAELADEMETATAPGRHEHFLRLDREFHLSAYAEAQTSVLRVTVERLWNRTQHYRRAFMGVAGRDDDRLVHYDHHLLVDALRRRDADDAEELCARHIRRTRLRLAQHPDLFRIIGRPADR